MSRLLCQTLPTPLTTEDLSLPRPEFRIFDEKLPCCKKVKVYFTLLLLTLIGGFLEKLGYACQLEHHSVF